MMSDANRSSAKRTGRLRSPIRHNLSSRELLKSVKLERDFDVAFRYFGGVPQELLFDQMKAVITRDLRLQCAALARNLEFSALRITGGSRRGPAGRTARRPRAKSGVRSATCGTISCTDGHSSTTPDLDQQRQQWLKFSCATIAASRPRCAPVGFQRPNGSSSLISPSSRRFAASRSRLELGFVERRENVVFLGPSGVGKTNLTISLAIAAAQSNRRVYYRTLVDLITPNHQPTVAGALVRS
jgi:hypothetical protein